MASKRRPVSKDWLSPTALAIENQLHSERWVAHCNTENALFDAVIDGKATLVCFGDMARNGKCEVCGMKVKKGTTIIPLHRYILSKYDII